MLRVQYVFGDTIGFLLADDHFENQTRDSWQAPGFLHYSRMQGSIQSEKKSADADNEI